MKCDNCKNNCYHPGGSHHAVAEGLSDPFPSAHCTKGHWNDGPENIENYQGVDPWLNCPDFEVKDA